MPCQELPEKSFVESDLKNSSCLNCSVGCPKDCEDSKASRFGAMALGLGCSIDCFEAAGQPP